MENTSVLELNYTSVPFDYFLCFNRVHVGIVLGYASMFLRVFLGTPAYCWLLWHDLRAGWKLKPTQVFPLNLTILELIFCIQCAVQMLNGLIFNIVMLWKTSFIVFGLTWAGRPLMQICICIEQYLAVIHPIMFMKYKALQYRIVCAAVVWLISAVYAVHGAYIYTFPDPVFNSAFFLAMIIISFCCVSLLFTLKRPGPGDTQIPVERGRDVGNQQKRKAFNTIFSGLLIILITYLPQVLLNFINIIEIGVEMFNCNIAPIMSSFILGVMITPLIKIYKKSGKKEKNVRPRGRIKENL